ncbi:MAG: class I SAM-dependent methyltransferase [Verrucomicrobia bacterium]|nr:class I SAM-dependent methyltransferase [Verrucomicrobiota bacterium]
MMTREKALQRLRAFAADIPRLYPKPVPDYRGRLVDANSVRQYLETEQYRFAEIAALLPPPPQPGARLLDLGIAYGFLAALLKEDGAWQCEGLELAANIPVYCAFAHDRGIPVHAGELGGGPLPFPESSFHAVIFSEVLEHLRLPPRKVFREMFRLLTPGGWLWVTTPNIARLTNIAKLAIGRNILEPLPESSGIADITQSMTHIREYTMRELVSLAEPSGFVVRRMRYSDCMEQTRPHHWITTMMPMWRGSLMLLAQKPL